MVGFNGPEVDGPHLSCDTGERNGRVLLVVVLWQCLDKGKGTLSS